MMGSKVVYTGDPAKAPAASQTAAPPLPPPPPYSPAPSTSASAPPAGLRVPCSTSTPFPQELAGPAPLRDLDGSPVWVASALFKDGAVRMLFSVHVGRCKKKRVALTQKRCFHRLSTRVRLLAEESRFRMAA